MIRRWVELLDEREPPTVLALMRVLLGVTVLFDLAVVGILDLPVWLWAPIEAGGTSPTATADSAALVYELLPATPGTAWGIYFALLLSCLAMTAGVFTRSSSLVFLLVYAQTQLLNDVADRGIDRGIRIVILILCFSAAGRAYSFDAWRTTGSFRGDGAPAPAWPRYLILGQLVVMYTAAGLSKSSTLWLPWGGHGALYVILNEPIYATMDFSWLAHPVFYFLTQVGTASSRAWELAAPVVLLALYYRRTPERAGRLRALMNRFPVRTVYAVFGVAFHLLLALTLRLGIFPFAMLAMFPALYRPDEIQAFTDRLVSRLRRVRTARA